MQAAKNQRIRGPSTTRKRAGIEAPMAKDEQQRLTLTMSKEDVEQLQRLADANIRSMAAQALFYIRAAIAQERKDN